MPASRLATIAALTLLSLSACSSPPPPKPGSTASADSPRMAIINIDRDKDSATARPPAPARPDHIEAHITPEGVALYRVPEQTSQAPGTPPRGTLLAPRDCHGVQLTVCATSPAPPNSSPATIAASYPVHAIYAALTAIPDVRSGQITDLHLGAHAKAPYALIVRIMDTTRYWRVGADGQCAATFADDDALLAAKPCEASGEGGPVKRALLPNVVIMTLDHGARQPATP